MSARGGALVRRAMACIVMCGALGLAGCAVPGLHLRAPTTLAVAVRDSLAGRPISEPLVSMRRWHRGALRDSVLAYGDGDGFVRLESIVAGVYELRVQRVGYGARHAWVRICAGTSDTIAVALIGACLHCGRHVAPSPPPLACRQVAWGNLI